ncbi:glyoxalase/bleomycin resistance/extradiol dioxygenase family protein [Paenibacillus sp. YN15]|uniref:VOC family protein n=1 Tax=Paenibacillus sp. YN15 TaxID=1742774 RepID=UPI000DCC8517|nr:VOC family protein [Paenibacillus sp. YN15]RAV05154.1 VOC family protein [Paenibacillus sp. YN15]
MIGEVSLLTNDVIALANFYKTILQIDNGSNDPVHQFIITEGTALTIYNDGIHRAKHNSNIALAFTVDNVDAEYERLKNNQVEIIEPPTTRPWGARNMHFVDPDGNHIYFRSFPTRDQEFDV